MHVQGIVNVERADKMMKMPHFALDMNFSKFLKLRHANGFRLEISSSNSDILAFQSRGIAHNENLDATTIGYLSLNSNTENPAENLNNFQTLDIPFNNMIQET
jgi:hypothetical protein